MKTKTNTTRQTYANTLIIYANTLVNTPTNKLVNTPENTLELLNVSRSWFRFKNSCGFIYSHSSMARN